jgi:hypothetical protein
MSSNDTIQLLRDELERQRQESEARHQALIHELQRQREDTQEPLTAADARETLRSGYGQSAAEREARKAGGES